jgi:hypothetical protein
MILLTTADPQLVTIVQPVLDYFENNLGVVIAVFCAVSLVLWLFNMATHAIGIEGEISSNYYGTDDEVARRHIDRLLDDRMDGIYDDIDDE